MQEAVVCHLVAKVENFTAGPIHCQCIMSRICRNIFFVQSETESRGSTYRREGMVAVKKEEAVEGGGQEHDDVVPGLSVKVETGAAEQGGMLKLEPGMVYIQTIIHPSRQTGWENRLQIQVPVVSGRMGCGLTSTKYISNVPYCARCAIPHSSTPTLSCNMRGKNTRNEDLSCRMREQGSFIDVSPHPQKNKSTLCFSMT